jgi:hypothetical protein
MNFASHSRVGLFSIAALCAIWVAGCSDDDDVVTESGVGGAHVGGNVAKGGASANKGGTSAKGGAANGGAQANGGSGGASTTPVPSGGAVSTGGAAVAGTSAVGTGGASVGAGGTLTTGGITGASGAAAGGTSAVVCGTTPSTIPTQTFAMIQSTNPATNLGGFAINTGAGANTTRSWTQTNISPAGAPADLCTAGCGVLSATFAADTAKYSNGAAISKAFSQATNLVGAKIVAKVAIDNPQNVPLQFKIFAQGPGPDWLWAESAQTTLSGYALASGGKAFEYVVTDSLDSSNRQFCASNIYQYGLQIQPSALVTAEGTVKVYVQSISIVAPGGSLGAGGAAGAGGVAGASSTGTAGSAGRGVAGGSSTGGAGVAGGGGSAGASTSSEASAGSENAGTAGTAGEAGSAGTAGTAGSS